MSPEPNVTVVKAAAELLGRPVGPVRAPGLETLNAEEHETLRHIVEAVRTERTTGAPATAA